MLRAAVLTQYRRVTDRQTDGRTDKQTDGIAVANTALAMPALRRAVKIILGLLAIADYFFTARTIAVGRYSNSFLSLTDVTLG